MTDWKHEIQRQLAGLKLEPAREAEIVEELSQHIEDRLNELQAAGVTNDEARETVVAELKQIDLLQNELRRVERVFRHEPVVLGSGRANLIEDLWQDIRYSMRSIRKHAMMSLIVVVTLTLGIGLSTGVFTYFNAQGLRAPVDRDFDSFAEIFSAYTRDPANPGRPSNTTLEDYLAYRDEAKSLRDLAAYADCYLPMSAEDAIDVRTLLVTSNFFSLYALDKPLMGRLLNADDEATANPVVVLSERLWRTRFSSDPEIVGKVIFFRGQPVTVVGVAPRFAGMVNSARAWFPYTLENYLKHGDNIRKPGETAWLKIAGRLNPGFSHRDAEAELNLLASRQDRLHPGRETTIAVTNGSAIQDPQAGPMIRTGFMVLVAALLIFVLIVCVNVSTLLLSRSAARRHEIAVRIALGAGRFRLVRMLVTETFLLASVAGIAGLYLAYTMPQALDRFLLNPSWETAGREYSVTPDWRVFSYLVLVTILAGMLAGLTPALQSLKVNLIEMLKGRQSMLGGARAGRLHRLLIAIQITLSFFLLYAAVLFARTAQKANSFETGFEMHKVLSTNLVARNRNQGSPGPFQPAFTNRLLTTPGIESVAYSGLRPFQIGAPSFVVQLPDRSERVVAINWVSPEYFSTLEIPIVAGRGFAEDDAPSDKTACQIVVSERLAQEFWPAQSSLGRVLRDRDGRLMEVIGVARDISSRKLGALDGAVVYQRFDLSSAQDANVLLRVSGEWPAIAREVTRTVRDAAPEVTFWSAPEPIQKLRDGLMISIWGVTDLVLLLCVTAVVLAVIGIYGVVSFAVSQRTKEVGIRLALGAQKGDIYKAILGTSGRPIVLGLLLGLAISAGTWWILTPLLVDQEFNFNSNEPLAYVMTAALLAAVALTAMLIPARRATHIDPMTALREE